MFLYRHAKIQGGKECKYVGLYECYQQFEQAHKNCKGYWKTNTYSKSQEGVNIPENKDQTNKAEYDGVTGSDIRKETNH